MQITPKNYFQEKTYKALIDFNKFSSDPQFLKFHKKASEAQMLYSFLQERVWAIEDLKKSEGKDKRAAILYQEEIIEKQSKRYSEIRSVLLQAPQEWLNLVRLPSFIFTIKV